MVTCVATLLVTALVPLPLKYKVIPQNTKYVSSKYSRHLHISMRARSSGFAARLGGSAILIFCHAKMPANSGCTVFVCNIGTVMTAKDACAVSTFLSIEHAQKPCVNSAKIYPCCASCCVSLFLSLSCCTN